MRVATLLHDMRRLARSARLHLHERRSANQADLGIAWLEAQGPESGHPHLRRYAAAITDLGPLPRPLRLTFEQWQAPRHGGPGGRVHYMTMDMHSRPLGRCTLGWLTDGHRMLRAFCDSGEVKTTLQADAARPRGRCAAILGLWLRERQVDRVVVYETLAGDDG